MPVIEESIVIARPAMEVYEFLTAPEKIPLYSSNMVEYEQVSGGPRDVGGVARGTVRVAGRRLTFTTEVVEVEPGRLARSRSSDASIPFRLELRFDEVAEGTRVTWHQETDELGGVLRQARRRGGRQAVRPGRQVQPGQRQDASRSLGKGGTGGCRTSEPLARSGTGQFCPAREARRAGTRG